MYLELRLRREDEDQERAARRRKEPSTEAADAACMVVQPDDATTDAATEHGAHNTGVKIDDDLEITEQKGMDPSVIAHSRSQCLKHDWQAGTKTQKRNECCNHCYCFVCQ